MNGFDSKVFLKKLAICLFLLKNIKLFPRNAFKKQVDQRTFISKHILQNLA